jgi:hypothetical protein
MHLHRTWLAAADSAPLIRMSSASSAAGAGIGPINVERFDSNGGEIPIATANRKAVRSPQQLIPARRGEGAER